MSNLPSHHLYHVIEREGAGADSKGTWKKIGAAWPHKDGKGFSVELEYLPLDGSRRFVLREARDEAASASSDNTSEITAGSVPF